MNRKGYHKLLKKKLDVLKKTGLTEDEYNKYRLQHHNLRKKYDIDFDQYQWIYHAVKNGIVVGRNHLLEVIDDSKPHTIDNFRQITRRGQFKGTYKQPKKRNKRLKRGPTAKISKHVVNNARLLHAIKESTEKGRMTDDLGECIVLMVEKYSKKNNWNAYSYIDEMKAEAVAHFFKKVGRAARSNHTKWLTKVGMYETAHIIAHRNIGKPYWQMFDIEFAEKFPYYRKLPNMKKREVVNVTQEAYDNMSEEEQDKCMKRQSNPFAYYTEMIKHVFIQYLKKEKEVQNLRDDLLEIAGANPSYTRRFRDEELG